MTGKIIASGSFIPPKIMTNDMIAEFVDTSDAWIKERTGISSRHIAEDDISVSHMAIMAAKDAMEQSVITPDKVGLIIVATSSTDEVYPAVSCKVQQAIGAVNAACFDLNAACSGFVFAYNTAISLLNSGCSSYALVIGAEKMSRLMDFSDRSTCILFGDGAGAVLIEAIDGVHKFCIHSDGAKSEALTCKTNGFIQMDGHEVFCFAVRMVPKVIMELLEREQVAIDEIDYFVIHQANMRIVQAIAKRLNISIEKFPENLSKYGNTSAASIPVLLDECLRKGMIKKGNKIVIAGFGAGLSWGATMIEF